MNKWLKALGLMILLALLIYGKGAFFSKPVKNDATSIRIGANLEKSGKFAYEGRLAEIAIAMAAEDINKAGGLLGKRLELVVRDNESSSQMSEQVFVSLVRDENVTAVVGPGKSPLALSLGPLADQWKMPFVATSATANRVTINDNGKPYQYAFRACFSSDFEGMVMACLAKDDFHAQHAAVYVNETSEYSKSLGSFFSAHFEKLGGKIVIRKAYASETMDFTEDAAVLTADNPDVIFLPAHMEAMRILSAIRKQGFKGTVLGGVGWRDIAAESENAETGQGKAYYCSHLMPAANDGKVKEFEERFKLRSAGDAPTMSAVLAYDAVLMIAQAIRLADSSKREAVCEALAQTKDLAAVAGTITLDYRHSAIKGAAILELQGEKSSLHKWIPPEGDKL